MASMSVDARLAAAAAAPPSSTAGSPKTGVAPARPGGYSMTSSTPTSAAAVPASSQHQQSNHHHHHHNSASQHHHHHHLPQGPNATAGSTSAALGPAGPAAPPASTPSAPGSAGAAGAGTASATHQAHIHHHHHQSQQQQQQQQSAVSAYMANHQQQQQQRSRKEDMLLLSLPSHDRESWYDRGDEIHGLDDPDEDLCPVAKTPRLSNRGHKLDNGAKFVRKGRLGGWENYEVFESKTPFPSNNRYPAAPPGINDAATSSMLPSDTFDRKIPGGFTVTPSLTMVPSTSVAASRTDNVSPLAGLYNSLQSASGANAGVGASSNQDGGVLAGDSGSSGRSKRRKQRHGAYTHDILASTSSNFSGYSSAPVRAYLPAPPQDPIDLVTSPLVARTFSPKTRTLEKLALSATELIEEDIPLIRALTRLIDFLRGNSVAGSAGLVGLPFATDVDNLLQAEDDAEETSEDKPVVNGDAEETEPQMQQNGTALSSGDHDEGVTPAIGNGAGKDEPAGNAGGSSENASLSNGHSDAQPAPPAENGIVVNGSSMEIDEPADPTTVAEEPAGRSSSIPLKRQRSASLEGTSAKPELVETGVDGTAGASDSQAALADSAEKSQVNGEGHAAGINTDQETKVQITNVTDGADVTAQTATESAVSKEPQRPPPSLLNGLGGEATVDGSRSSSPSSSGQGEIDEQLQANRRRPLRTARLPKSVQRIANPQPYIDSLFVTPQDIVVPLMANSGGGRLASELGERSSSIPAGHMRLTPTEQQETVRLCLGELTKFLADTLEYQDRLAEIRDTTLGVERRRKGVWSMARGYAHQMLWEEEQEKLAQASRQ